MTVALAALATSCGGGAPAPKAPDPVQKARGAPIRFEFESLDDRAVSTEAMHGRATLIAFVATYGDASIVQARFLKKLAHEVTPRINAVAIFMEPIDNRPLARIFRDAVGIDYPCAMADSAQIQGKGAFGGVDTVPSVVVLDGEGREVWRKTGVAFPEELRNAIQEAQAGVWGTRR